MAEQSFEQFVERLLLILKDRRKELGLTQGELGERVGKPQSAVARLESGAIKDPHLSMIYLFCNALELKLIHPISTPELNIIKQVDELSERFEALKNKISVANNSNKAALLNILQSLETLIAN